MTAQYSVSLLFAQTHFGKKYHGAGAPFLELWRKQNQTFKWRSKCFQTFAVRFFQEMNLIVSKHGRTAFRLLSRVFNAGNCSDSESMRFFWKRGTQHKQQLSTCALVSALHIFTLTVVLQAQCKQQLSPHKAMQMLSYRSSRLSPVERFHLAQIPFCVSFSYSTDVNFKTI